MYFFNFTKENTPPVQQNIGEKVVYEGWLYKWTNFIGSWRQRYFTLYSGSLSYSIEKNSPVKETFSLSHCKIRICPDDPVRLEIDTLERGIIFLRTDNITEKQKWYVAIKRTQQQYLKACRRDVRTPSGIYSVLLPDNSGLDKSELIQKFDSLNTKLSNQPLKLDRVKSLENTDNSPIDINELFIKSSADLESKSPLNCLISNLISFKEISNVLFSELHSLESTTLSSITSILQSDTIEIDKTIESNFIDLIHRVESIENLITNFNNSMDNLLSEESAHTKQLEKSLKWLAKQNYQLEKAQLNSDVRKGKGDESIKRSPGPLGSTKLSQELKAVTNERLLMSNEQETDDEFYECEDNNSESKSLSSKPSITEKQIESDKNDDVIKEETPIKDDVVDDDKFEWRTKLPVPRTSLKVSLWSILKECVGKDISRICLPVYLNEPTSFLQRASEDYEYYTILEKAATYNDSVERTAWLSIFTMTPYESAVGRTYKPFNPLLGETYELTHMGYDFFTEQVEHHPPLAAFDCKGKNFHSFGHTFVQSKVTGKSVEVKVFGPYYIDLKPINNNENEHYRVQRANLIVHNIIFGALWIEFVGTTIITNFTTGDFTIIQFLKKGWFDKEIHKTRGVVFDANGNGCYYINGIWSSYLTLERVKRGTSVFITPWKYCNGDRMITLKNSLNYDKKAFKTEGDAWDSFISNIDWDNIQVEPNSRVDAWKPNKKPPSNSAYYGFTYMTLQLAQVSPHYDPAKVVIANTDSRFRPDIIAYEKGDLEYAGKEKHRVEEKQRRAARARTSPYQPLYFKKVPHPITDELVYMFNNLYWERKRDGTLNKYSPDIF